MFQGNLVLQILYIDISSIQVKNDHGRGINIASATGVPVSLIYAA